MKYTKKKFTLANLRVYFLWSSLAVLCAITIFLTIEMVTSGAETAKLERQESILTQENKDLSEKVVKGTSLAGIEGRADELGFRKPEEVIYIGQTRPVAKLP